MVLISSTAMPTNRLRTIVHIRPINNKYIIRLGSEPLPDKPIK
jgi:hypothetical protein